MRTVYNDQVLFYFYFSFIAVVRTALRDIRQKHIKLLFVQHEFLHTY